MRSRAPGERCCVWGLRGEERLPCGTGGTRDAGGARVGGSSRGQRPQGFACAQATCGRMRRGSEVAGKALGRAAVGGALTRRPQQQQQQQTSLDPGGGGCLAPGLHRPVAATAQGSSCGDGAPHWPPATACGVWWVRASLLPAYMAPPAAARNGAPSVPPARAPPSDWPPSYLPDGRVANRPVSGRASATLVSPLRWAQ